MPNFNDLIGKKFKYNTFGPDEYDCYGLCMEVCGRVGINLPDQYKFAELQTPYPEYEVRGDDRTSMVDKCVDAAVSKWFKKLDKPEPYCIIVFTKGPHFAGHVGVVIDKYKFIHTLPEKNCCIERLDQPLLQKKIEGFYRYVGQFNQS
jgi:hypothetical protein